MPKTARLNPPKLRSIDRTSCESLLSVDVVRHTEETHNVPVHRGLRFLTTILFASFFLFPHAHSLVVPCSGFSWILLSMKGSAGRSIFDFCFLLS